jgi:polyisoprenoid-binding protein YceI
MAAKQWEVDRAHSSIQFVARHMLITKVRGRFRRWEGSFLLDEKDITNSQIDVSIDAASIDTNDDKRDAHLRSPDFLDVMTFPKITFKSTRIAVTAPGRLDVSGELTIRDVTKSITLAVQSMGRAKDPWGNTKIAFSGTVAIQREEFGARWNQALETGGFLVSKQVEVELELQAIAPPG